MAADESCDAVYVALGGNVGDILAAFDDALARLEGAVGPLLAVSPAYLTRPQQLPDDTSEMAPFYNAVCRLRSALPPLALLDALQAIEVAAGRRPGRRWGPRVLDLDLLLVGQRRLQHARLVLPHPQLLQRLFVLQPLADIAPQLRVPGSDASVAAHLQQFTAARRATDILARQAWPPRRSPQPSDKPKKYAGCANL